jgi:hypothetical protein
VQAVVRRVIVGLVVAMLGVGLLGAVGAAAASPSTRVPKVVLVVGPAGGATDRYRAEARSAASLARRYTSDVTEIYSPDATWPVVKEALQGASVVVYMGHGNGWPSRYRDALYPPSQNGFGLNPTAGGGDGTHQYFGEGPIGESVRGPCRRIAWRHHVEVARQDQPATALAARPPDDDRQRLTGHLLARPSRVAPEGRKVRPDDLDPQTDVQQCPRRPVRDVLLGTGDATDLDQRLEVVDQPVAIDLNHAGSGVSYTSAHQIR